MIFVNTQVKLTRLDALLTTHVNHTIQDVFEKRMRGIGFDDPRDVFVENKIFCTKVRKYLPKSYPFHRIGEAFLGAYYMVKSDTLYAPDRINAYIIHAVLIKEISMQEVLRCSLYNPLPEWECLLDELSETVAVSEEEARDIRRDIEHIRKQVCLCEDIRRYSELCGIDADPYYLDILSEKKLKHLIKMNDRAGVLAVRQTS